MSRRIAIVATGGTIGKRGTDGFDLLEYQAVGTRIPIADLVAEHDLRIPSGTRLELHEFTAQSSKTFAINWWTSLAQFVEALVEDGVDGIVVTHGTSTLEETSLFLGLTVDAKVPVVVVGAMRPLGSFGSDAILNLSQALRVAATPASRGRGVLVVMNSCIYLAAGVTKGSATDVDAFTDRTFGPIGRVGSSSVYFQVSMGSSAQPVVKAKQLGVLPRVDVAYSAAGVDGVEVDAFVGAGARGVVVAGLGTGYPSSEQMRRLSLARDAGVLVLCSTRTGRPVLELPQDLREAGFVSAGHLGPAQARVLALVALAATSSLVDAESAVQRFVAESLCLEVHGL